LRGKGEESEGEWGASLRGAVMIPGGVGEKGGIHGDVTEGKEETAGG
jgi:hypothetical protein